jgi:hypothetical protein
MHSIDKLGTVAQYEDFIVATDDAGNGERCPMFCLAYDASL